MCVYHQAEWRPTQLIFSMPWLLPPLSSVCCSGPCDGIVATKKGSAPALCSQPVSQTYCTLLSAPHTLTYTWQRWLSQLCFAGILDEPQCTCVCVHSVCPYIFRLLCVWFVSWQRWIGMRNFFHEEFCCHVLLVFLLLVCLRIQYQHLANVPMNLG